MTPSKRIDRVFAGVGRIALSSGTDHGPTFKRINAMLTGLHKIGRLDVLAQIRDGVHSPLVVLFHYERGQLDRLPSTDATMPLLTSFRAFVAAHECGTAQRRNMETTARHLERLPGGATAPIAQLSTLLRALKETMRDRKVAFNKCRGHCLTYASEIKGAQSPFWLEVMRVKRYKQAAGKLATHRRPLTVAELDAVCATYTDHAVFGGKRGGGRSVRAVICAGDVWHMTRFLATTGLRPAEYWQRNGATWTPRPDHIAVHGTKTAAATRPTFRLGSPWPPVCGEQFFRKAFGDATEKALGLRLDVYSLRRTFAALCEEAGIVESRREAYMGHGPKDITDIYLKTNVLPFVAADCEKLSAWIAAERARTAAPTLKMEKRS